MAAAVGLSHKTPRYYGNLAQAAKNWLAAHGWGPTGELDDALRFVAARYLTDGSGVRFSNDRCTGISSDALAWFGVGVRDEPKDHEYPHDEEDLAACERTYGMAPPCVRQRMLPVLRSYRMAVHSEREEREMPQ